MSWVEFVKQRAKMECGPVALINTAKSLDLGLSYKNYSKIMRSLCGYDARLGTTRTNFDNALHRVCGWLAEIKFIPKPIPSKLEVEMERGATCIIIKYRNPYTDNGHYAVIPICWSGRFTIVNFEKDKKTSKVAVDELEKVFSHSPNHTYAWVVTKRKV